MELVKVTYEKKKDATKDQVDLKDNDLNSSCYPSNCAPTPGPCGPDCNPYINCQPTR